MNRIFVSRKTDEKYYRYLIERWEDGTRTHVYHELIRK